MRDERIAMFFMLLLCAGLAHAQQNLQVNTTEGVVVGAMAAGGAYYNFYGLRYGAPPTGDNRFKVNICKLCVN